MTEIRRMQPLLGTYVEIGAHGEAASDALVTAAFAAVRNIHDLASFQSPDSVLTQLNRNPGVWMELPCHLLRLLRIAREMTRRSDGLFNCTVGGDLVALGVLPDHGGPPALLRGEADDIELQGRQARLRCPVRITLDGIAKGFAVDRAIAVLRHGGAESAWVNAGGDLRVFGDLQLPVQRREADESLTFLGHVRDAAVASSVLRSSPDTRYPGFLVGGAAESETRTWTVLARQAWRADALTKVAALAADDRRDALLEKLGGILLRPALP
ncbi:MAG: FAD:protein FMN transferase [Pedobacter sp.]|nr:FAD:protein FMN transferase [Pedobacter sp.]